jgi:WD40 repeat protein
VEADRKNDNHLPLIIGAVVGGGTLLLLFLGVVLYLLLSPGQPVEQTAQLGVDPNVSPTPAPAPKVNPTPVNPPKEPPQVVKPADDGTLFGAIETAIKGGTSVRTRLVGGGFGGADFVDVPEEGAILTGLEVGLGKFGPQDVIHSLRPIYQSKKGRILGALHGGALPRVITVEAKAGYAVGCVTVKAGAGLDGSIVTFMAIEGKILDPARCYQSEWIGGVGGVQPVSLVGDGTPIIGIFGRDNNNTTGLGLVSLSAPQGPPNIPPFTMPTAPAAAPFPLAARVQGEVKGFNLPRGAAPLRFAGSADRAVLLELTQARLYDLDRVRVLKTFPAGKFTRCMDVTANGKTLALGASDGTVRLWDLETGNAGQTLQYDSNIACVAFSPDGKLLAVGGRGLLPKAATGRRRITDYGVQLWNVETGMREHRFSVTSPIIRSIAFTGDGKYLLASTSGRPYFQAWEVQSHRALPGCDRVPLRLGLQMAAVDSKQVLLGAISGEIVLWDLPGARVVRAFRGHTTPIHKLAVLPGGKQFASIAGQGVRGQSLIDATLRLWDIQKGREVGWTSFPEVPQALGVSPDGTQALVAAREGPVRLIDLGKLTASGAPVIKSAKPLRPEDRFKGHTGAVTSLAYSPDGKHLLSGGADGTARLWDVATGGEIHKLAAGGGVTRVCFSGDGQILGVFIAGRCQGFNVDKGTLTWSAVSDGSTSGCLDTDAQEVILTGSTFLRTYSPQKRSTNNAFKKAKTTCAAYSPDGTFYSYGDALGSVHVHSTILKQDVGSYPTHKAAVECLVAYGGMVPRVISGGADNAIVVRSGTNLTSIKRLTGHTATVTSLSLSTDGKLLASGSEDRTVRVWDVGTAKVLHRFTDENEILGVALSPNGKVVVSCSSKGMRFWNLTDSAKP